MKSSEAEPAVEPDLPFVYVALKVGHEPMPPTVGTNVLGRKVLYLPSFFTYGECAAQAGKPMPTKRKHQMGSRSSWPWGTPWTARRPESELAWRRRSWSVAREAPEFGGRAAEHHSSGPAPLPQAGEGRQVLGGGAGQDTDPCHPWLCLG